MACVTTNGPMMAPHLHTEDQAGGIVDVQQHTFKKVRQRAASVEAPELFREKYMETRWNPWDFRTFRSYGLLDFQKKMEDRGRKK